MKIFNETLPDYSGSDYNAYYKETVKDYKNIIDYFPLLNLTVLPTVKAKEIYLTGKLIPYEVLKECKTKGDINRNSVDVRIIFPSEYPTEMLVIEDVLKSISWDKIPLEHVHKNVYKNNIEVLCTHHPNGEINKMDKDIKSIAVLHSGWRLYMQCKQYIRSGIWTLQDLEHGDAAIKQLKSAGEYYVNRR